LGGEAGGRPRASGSQRTVGVSQLFIHAQIETMEAGFSNMVAVSDREIEFSSSIII